MFLANKKDIYCIKNTPKFPSLVPSLQAHIYRSIHLLYLAINLYRKNVIIQSYSLYHKPSLNQHTNNECPSIQILTISLKNKNWVSVPSVWHNVEQHFSNFIHCYFWYIFECWICFFKHLTNKPIAVFAFILSITPLYPKK